MNNNNAGSPSSGGGFAAQFYPQAVSRSVPRDNIPTVPDRQATSSPDTAPFSAVRMAFTQAIAPVAISIGGSNGPSPKNTVSLYRSGEQFCT